MDETGDRMDRAGRYVLGLMDRQEREQAERDLEVDPAFRVAMVEMAERLNAIGRPPVSGGHSGTVQRDPWMLIKERIEALPQMLAGGARRPITEEDRKQREASGKVTFGRRKTDKLIGRTAPVASTSPVVPAINRHSLPVRKAWIVALALIFAFTFGYLVGVHSTPHPRAETTLSSP